MRKSKEEEEKPSNVIWERVKIISTLIASILVPIVIALIGYWYSNAMKERELQIRYLELATNILSQQPQKEQIYIRQWAVQIIKYYSEIPLADSVENNLIYKGYIPKPVVIKIDTWDENKSTILDSLMWLESEETKKKKKQ